MACLCKHPELESSCDQCKLRDLRPYVEPRLDEVAETSINVKALALAYVDFACSVAFVLDGKQRRLEERRFALPTMRVSGKDPPTIVAPLDTIDGIWIVADSDGCCTSSLPECVKRITSDGPEIVDANEVQAVNCGNLVAEDSNPCSFRFSLDARSDMGLRPVESVIMVSEDAQCRDPTAWHVLQHASQSLKLGIAGGRIVSDKITSDHGNVSVERSGLFERRDQVRA